MLFWGKEYFLVNCLAKRKEFKKCEANKFAVIRQAFGSWAVCSLFLWYYVTWKDWSLKTEFKLMSELCLYSPVLCVGDAEAWSIAAITTFLVGLLRSVALWEVLTSRAVYVSCLCNFCDAVGLSGTSNALYFCFPMTLLLSFCLHWVLVPCADHLTQPGTADSSCWRCPKLSTTLHTLRDNSVHWMVISEGMREISESLSKSLMEMSGYW